MSDDAGRLRALIEEMLVVLWQVQLSARPYRGRITADLSRETLRAVSTAIIKAENHHG